MRASSFVAAGIGAPILERSFKFATGGGAMWVNGAMTSGSNAPSEGNAFRPVLQIRALHTAKLRREILNQVKWNDVFRFAHIRLSPIKLHPEVGAASAASHTGINERRARAQSSGALQWLSY